MFKNLKDFYKRNRVYSILMIISITCVIAIVVGVILYFVGQTNKDKYGNRLNGIESVRIKEEKINEIEKKISEHELVKETTINIKGKLIYIIISLNSGSHQDSESIAQSSLELFTDEEKAFYDIHYTVENLDKKSSDNFPVMGSITSGNSVIKWTNYVSVGEES